MSTRQGLAYDLSKFEPNSESKTHHSRPKLLPKRIRDGMSTIRPAEAAKLIAVCLVIMLALVGMMVGNIKVAQLDENVSAAQKKLDTAKSEQVRLSAELESRMSLQKVENYAVNNLGLIKINPYQIQYVNITNKDKVEISSRENPVFAFFKNLYDDIMEYFN